MPQMSPLMWTTIFLMAMFFMLSILSSMENFNESTKKKTLFMSKNKNLKW